ncbi:CBS domain-containing protein [Kitasatospora cineracea]|uniref:CBS domain-containing protein n=1 Tax=Kitasatospora cineracea TaxID=88074 RepID=UPI00378C8352
MQPRTVRDVMTRDVVTARRDTTFQEITGLLLRHHVGALPVVDERHRPVGIVSEADLVRAEAGPPGRRGGPARGGTGSAEQLMTSPVVVARPDWSLVGTARVMHHGRLKHLPVVDGDGRLTGVVSRSDLLRPLLRDDEEIRREIVDDVLLGSLWLPAHAVRVAVEDGVVTLTGTVERRSLVPLVETMCRSLDGVVEVRQSLAFTRDDTLLGGCQRPPDGSAAPAPAPNSEEKP